MPVAYVQKLAGWQDLSCAVLGRLVRVSLIGQGHSEPLTQQRQVCTARPRRLRLWRRPSCLTAPSQGLPAGRLAWSHRCAALPSRTSQLVTKSILCEWTAISIVVMIAVGRQRCLRRRGALKPSMQGTALADFRFCEVGGSNTVLASAGRVQPPCWPKRLNPCGRLMTTRKR